MRKIQKQYNNFTEKQKEEFKEFLFKSQFIQRSYQWLLFDYDKKLSYKEKILFMTFLWDCYFDIVSPIDQSLNSYLRFSKAENGKEMGYICINDWDIWSKLQKISNDFEYENWIEKFNILLDIDTKKFCGLNRKIFKIKRWFKKKF